MIFRQHVSDIIVLPTLIFIYITGQNQRPNAIYYFHISILRPTPVNYSQDLCVNLSMLRWFWTPKTLPGTGIAQLFCMKWIRKHQQPYQTGYFKLTNSNKTMFEFRQVVEKNVFPWQYGRWSIQFDVCILSNDLILPKGIRDRLNPQLG